MKSVKTRKEAWDVTSNYSFGAFVRRRRRLLRVFQMGDGRGPWNRWNGPAYFIDCLFNGWVALIH